MQKNKFVLICVLLFVAFGVRLQAQGLFACPGLNNATSTCATSCINCNLDGITGINNVNLPPGAPNSLCHDQIILENPRWYGFIAGSTNLTLAVFPTNCQTGQGLEAAIQEDCSATPVCVAGPNPLNGFGSFFVSANNLVVGRPYQLVIDGFNGDVCNFSFLVIAGSTVPPPMGAVDPIQGQSQVCPNATTTYTIPPVSNALSYTWTSPAGSSINGGGNTKTLPATGNNNSVEIHFGNSGGNVCVTASNACSTPVTVCMPVSNVPIPTTVLDNQVICNELLPYEWPEEPHNILAAPGTYTLTSTPYQSYLGCDSMVRQTLKVLPANVVNLPLKYICKDECFEINGIEYCETGTYQEHLVSYTGCDSLVNFSLFKIPVKAVIQKPDTITCAVTSVPLSGTGSTTGNTVSYKWVDPNNTVISNAITATATMVGQYALIVTNFIGGIQCKDTAYVNVIGNLTPPMADAGPDLTISCAIPQVQLQGSGSMGSNYSYFWKPLLGGNIVTGVNTLTPIVNAAGTYSLRVTNLHNGCTAVSNAVVSALTTPPTAVVTGGSLTCSNPSIPVQLMTNAANGTFVWEGPGNFTSTQQSPLVNVEGTYTVTVTDGVSGCTNSGLATVIDNTAPPGVDATGGAITCIQSSVTLNATSQAQGVTFTWTGPGGFTSNIANPTVTATGNYTVVAHSPNGCTSTDVATVSLNNTPPGTTLSASSSLNCNNSMVNLLATSSGNPANLQHEWTLPGGGTTNTGSQSFLATGTPGVYNVLVTNTVTGCTSTATFTLVQRSNVTAAFSNQQNATCSDASNGSLTALGTGGSGTFNYLWNNGDNTATSTGLSTGVYVVTITDSEGCTASASATVSSPPALHVNGASTDQSANGVMDGTASANPSGGTPGYSYLWNTGDTTQTISGLDPGAYVVTVTDSNGCTSAQTLNVSAYNCTVQSNVLVSNISCFGQVDGAATLDISGGTSPFVIVWSTGDTTAVIDSLPAGQYSVSITDAANCPEIQTFTIAEPQLLEANATGSTTSGANSTDGTAIANPTGGSGNYHYMWTTGDTTQMISNLAPGAYRLTVTDDNGCVAITTVEVLPGNCGLTTNLLITSPSCSGVADGSATILVSGGGSFTYLWSSGGATETENGLPAGMYTVAVTDDAGCQINVPVVVNDPPAIVITPGTIVPTTCANQPGGSAEVSISGGTGVLAISWSTGADTTAITGLIAGTYTATVTDESGCTSTATVSIVSNDTENPTLAPVASQVPIGPNGDVVLTTQNVNTGAADNCSIASVLFSPAGFNCMQLGDHVVTLTATDFSGNSATATVTVTIVDNTPPSLICSPSLVLCFEDNPVTYQAPTASDNCLVNGGSFNIIEGLPIGAVFPVGSTTTTYSFTDAQGNTGTCSFEITILPQLNLVVDTVINDFNNQHIGSAFVHVSGSLPPYTYSWTLNGQQVATSQNLSGQGGGDYTLVVTDDNGCTTSQTVTILSTSATNTPELLNSVVVFPNPTSGLLNVLLPDDLMTKDVFIQAYDLTGRKMLEQNSLNDKQISLDMQEFSSGLYTLVIRVDGSQIVKKIAVNK